MNYYQGYYQPQDQLAYLRSQQPMQMQPQQSAGIQWVQGEEGAKAFLVAAGNSVLLMDSDAERFYIKSTDPSGMPLPLRVFDYKERITAPQGRPPAAHPPEEYVTRQEYNALVSRIDAMQEEKEIEA